MLTFVTFGYSDDEHSLNQYCDVWVSLRFLVNLVKKRPLISTVANYVIVLELSPSLSEISKEKKKHKGKTILLQLSFYVAVWQVIHFSKR